MGRVILILLALLLVAVLWQKMSMRGGNDAFAPAGEPHVTVMDEVFQWLDGRRFASRQTDRDGGVRGLSSAARRVDNGPIS